MEPETTRSAERPTDRAVITDFYARVNHLVTDRANREQLAATLADDVRWRVVTNGVRAAQSYRGVDAVLDNVAAPARERATHLQALPERFVEADDETVVEGAYVGTVDETETKTEFEIPFVHVYALEDGLIRRCREYTDTAREREVFGPY